MLLQKTNLDKKSLNLLEKHGFFTLEDISKVSKSAMLEFEGVGNVLVTKLEEILKDNKLSFKIAQSVKKSRSPRKRAFAIILYPYEDEYHQLLYRYFTLQCKDCRVVYILHDKDLKDEFLFSTDPDIRNNSDNYKKPHVHLMYEYRNPRSLDEEIKKLSRPKQILSGDDSFSMHVEMVSNARSYMVYLAHADTESRILNKHYYGQFAIQGNITWRDSCFSQDDYDSVYQVICNNIINNYWIYTDLNRFISDMKQFDYSYWECYIKYHHIFSKLCDRNIIWEDSPKYHRYIGIENTDDFIEF